MTAGIALSKITLGTYWINTSTYDTETIAANTFYAKVIGFNHNKDLETDGNPSIHFALGSTSDGTDIAIVEPHCYGKAYNTSPNRAGQFAHKYSITADNSGGWASSKIRTTVLPKFFDAIPTAWQNVISIATKYTDNTGGTSGSASNVTATNGNSSYPKYDKLFLMSMYEILGKIAVNSSNAKLQNPYEADFQEQYDYYKNGASIVRYKHNNISTACDWWFRSPSITYASSYNRIHDGGSGSCSANCSLGIVPCFVIS